MDEATFEVMLKLNLSNVELISIDTFEEMDEGLLKAKQNRSLVEYYFTCTPSLPLYILNTYLEVDIITYLDADLYFFSDPAVLYKEMGDASVAIIGHRFPEGERYKEKYGIYNVGYISFRRDENALQCLQWWRECCIEWCYDRVDNGRFADQKYLDDWVNRFEKVVVIEHKGANLAPWNLARYKISLDNGILFVDEVPIIFYHFHGLKQTGYFLYDFNLTGYRVRASKTITREIYIPYIKALNHARELLSIFKVKVELNNNQRHTQTITSPFQRLLRRIITNIKVCKKIFLKDVILYFGRCEKKDGQKG